MQHNSGRTARRAPARRAQEDPNAISTTLCVCVCDVFSGRSYSPPTRRRRINTFSVSPCMRKRKIIQMLTDDNTRRRRHIEAPAGGIFLPTCSACVLAHRSQARKSTDCVARTERIIVRGTALCTILRKHYAQYIHVRMCSSLALTNIPYDAVTQ